MGTEGLALDGFHWVALGGHVGPAVAPSHTAKAETVTAVDVSNDLQDALEEPSEL